MNIIKKNPLDTGNLFKKLRKRNSGSIIFHDAVVKSRTGKKPLSGRRFERDGHLESDMSEIEADIRNRWSIDNILLVRRIGLLQVGDLIPLVAVSSAASNDALEACQYGLSRIRKMARLKKTELILD